MLLLFFPTTGVAQDVVLNGNTYRMNGPNYENLPGVKIVVTRGNAVVREGTSGQDGRFNLLVPSGSPFTVAFYGEKRVPELQQLAGLSAPRARDLNVNITLLTPEQYREQRERLLPLAQKLQCDLAMLPVEAREAREAIQDLFKAVVGVR